MYKNCYQLKINKLHLSVNNSSKLMDFPDESCLTIDQCKEIFSFSPLDSLLILRPSHSERKTLDWRRNRKTCRRQKTFTRQFLRLKTNELTIFSIRAKIFLSIKERKGNTPKPWVPRITNQERKTDQRDNSPGSLVRGAARREKWLARTPQIK